MLTSRTFFEYIKEGGRLGALWCAVCFVILWWWVLYVVIGSFCGGCIIWWLGHSVVGHCVVGHCVVGAQCGGYAMVVNVPNPARCLFRNEYLITGAKLETPKNASHVDSFPQYDYHYVSSNSALRFASDKYSTLL